MKINEISIGIIGLGQIGASIGAGLRGKVKKTIGFDIDPTNTTTCIESGFIDISASPNEISACADMVFIATPVNQVSRIASEILNQGNPKLIVCDVGSTKEHICRELSQHPNRKRFVATHPMAGNAGRGPNYASGKMFYGNTVYICDEHHSASNAIEMVSTIWSLLGSKISFINADEHDKLMSYISHLPQIVAYALTNTMYYNNIGGDWLAAASGGFNSMTRLAQSSASMWMPIVEQNRQNILKSIDDMQTMLSIIKNSLQNSDYIILKSIIENANRVRETFELVKNQITLNHENQKT